MTKVRAQGKGEFSHALLAWYEANSRDLPWRTSPADRRRGVLPDPYRVWLSEIMLQQTTVATVRPRFNEFLARWPTVRALADAPQEDVLAAWAGLGYYARARNLHACARRVAVDHGGAFPRDVDGLQTLPGIGPYTAAAIAAIAFDIPATVVDGNVDRVIVRQFAIDRPIGEAKAEIYQHAADLTPDLRPGDYAQAMMDLGATVCRPATPDCPVCPVQGSCEALKRAIAPALPVKPSKKPRPTRRGHVYVAINRSGEVAAERRPATGLFGGMAGLPGSSWEAALPVSCPPFAADWQARGQIIHVLTHFRLELMVHSAMVSKLPKGFAWADPAVLPTVFRKAVDRAGDLV